MEKPSFPPLLKQKLLNLLNRVNGVFDKIKKYHIRTDEVESCF